METNKDIDESGGDEMIEPSLMDVVLTPKPVVPAPKPVTQPSVIPPKPVDSSLKFSPDALTWFVDFLNSHGWVERADASGRDRHTFAVVDGTLTVRKESQKY